MLNPHQMALKMYCNDNPNYQTKEFRKNVLKALIPNCISCNCEECKENMDESDYEPGETWETYKANCRKDTIAETKKSLPKCVPDAYFIDKENRDIYILEIEDSSKVSAEKLYEYGLFFFYLDCEEWTVRLFVTDRWNNKPKEIDLSFVWLSNLKAAHEEKKRKEKASD